LWYGNQPVTIRGVPRPAPRGDPFHALGNPQRRAIVQLLARGECSVQQIANQLPISRPAVSRHLKLLTRAGLVSDQPRGARHLYRLEGDGIELVRAYLEDVWGEVAVRFRLFVENTSHERTPT
jgi:DNA-binding transcriptional ArsR family regulator